MLARSVNYVEFVNLPKGNKKNVGLYQPLLVTHVLWEDILPKMRWKVDFIRHMQQVHNEV